MMVIDNKFNIGDMVYLVTDADQLPRVITNIEIRPGNCLVYRLCIGASMSNHYEFEISAEKETALHL